MSNRKAYMKEYNKQYRAEHPEFYRLYYQKHKVKYASKHKEYRKQYYQTHKVEIAKYKKQWQANHLSFVTWCNMKQRCLNPNCKPYKWYGSRGISICKEWLVYKAFEKWALANGYEEGLTIDRIDNDGNYCPENCQWITRSENSKRRGGLRLDFIAETA